MRDLIFLACTFGFFVVAIVSGLPWDVATIVCGHSMPPPVWLLQIEFPWRIMFGTLTTYSVAWCFRKA